MIKSKPDLRAEAQSSGVVTVTGVIFIVLFWLIMVLLRLPYGYLDDNEIVGPALGIVSRGYLKNIYISPRFYPGDIYLFYPPVWFWIGAAWISLFGKSLLSLSAMWGCANILASVSLANLLRTSGIKNVSFVAAPFFLFGLTAYLGFRYEPVAIALFLLGTDLMLRQSVPLRLVGAFLIFLSPTIAPTMVGTVFVAVIAFGLVAVERKSLVNLVIELTMGCIPLAYVDQTGYMIVHGTETPHDRPVLQAVSDR